MVTCAMNFTRENRKEVYDFFAYILRCYYNEPVYYEYVRGHVSKASDIVKQYIFKKCKGDNLLKYFEKRKNYFDVEETKVSLRKEPKIKSSPKKTVIEKKKIWKTPKFNRKRSSESFSSNASDEQVDIKTYTGKLEHENYIYKHFIRLLEGKKVVKIESIDFEKLPKKVVRHLSLYCNNSIINYLIKFPDTFVIDDNKNVYLSDKTYISTNSDFEKSSNLVTTGNKVSVSISPEIQHAYIWLESVEFFLLILKKQKNTNFHVDRLASYLSQANESVKAFLKSYKPFRTFFSEAPLLFCLNDDEVSLSNHYDSVLQEAKNQIRYASERLHECSMSLISVLRDIVRPSSELKYRNKESTYETDFEDELENQTDEQSDEDKNVEQSEDKSVEQSEDKNVEQSEDKSVEQSEDKSVEQSEEDKNLEQSDDKNFEQSDDKNFEQSDDKNIEQSERDNIVMQRDEESISKDNEKTSTSVLENKVSVDETAKNMPNEDQIDQGCVMPFTSSLDNVHNGVDLKINNSDECDYKILQFLFTIQLFCAEVVEKENNYCNQYKIKAIKFYIDILNSQICSFTSLRGKIGQAPPEIISFMNKMYKGAAFFSFFEEHEEFILKSPLVSLSPTYKDSYQKRLDTISKYQEEFCLENLYESNRYKTLLKEVFALFFDVNQRLMTSNKIKVSRLCNVIEKFPDCLEWIKSSNGNTLTEKIESFFKLANIFEFSEEGFVSYSSQKKNILRLYFKQMSDAFQNSKLEMPVFKLVKDTNNACRKVLFNCEKDCFWSFVEFFESLKDVIEDINCSHYYEIVGILPEELLFKLAETGKDSRIIISALLKNGQFMMKEGRIKINNSNFNWEHLDENCVLEKTTSSGEDVCNGFDITPQKLNCEVLQKDLYNDPNNLNNIEHHKSPNSNLNPIDDLSENVYSEHDTHTTKDSNSCATESIDFQCQIIDCDKKQTIAKSVENALEGSFPVLENPIMEDFNSDVSDNQSQVADIEASSISDESDSTCEPSKLTICLNNEPPNSCVSNNLVNGNDDLKHHCIPPVSEKEGLHQSEIDPSKQENSLAVINNFFILNEPSCLNENHLESKKECDNYEIQSVIGNVPDSNKGVEDHQTDLIHSAEVDSDLKKSVLNSISDSSRFSPGDECKENNEAKHLYEKGNTFEHNENEVFITHQSAVESSFSFNNSSSSESGDFENSNLVPLISANNLYSLKKSKDSNKSLDVAENTSTFEHPLQPINAQIVLLTINSCIAQAKIASSTQNIYFLKCVFSCEEENCCSDCFDALHIGDFVSCFVPITELSCKMWIPIMVSKEESKKLKEMDHINQMLQNQKVNGFYRQCEVGNPQLCKKYNSKDISVQTENLHYEQGCQIEISVKETFCQTEVIGEEKFCQTEILSEETFCQTVISGNVREKFAVFEAMCQTNSVLVHDVSLQAGYATNSSDCQTDISGIKAICVECQTDLVGSVKKCVNSVNSLCQTNLSGEVKESIDYVNSTSQTIATGPVMAINYYHFDA